MRPVCAWLGLVWLAACVCRSDQEYPAKLKAELEELIDVLDDLMNLREIKAVAPRSSGNGGHNTDESQRYSEEKARDWLNKNDVKLARELHDVIVLSWAYMTNLTDENAEKLEDASVAESTWEGQRIREARAFLEHSDDYQDETVVRMLQAWVYSSSVPVADSEETIQKISSLSTQLEGIYGNAEVEHDGTVYRMEPEFGNLMATSRDYDELQWAWVAWRDITGPQMRPLFTEMVDAMNEAARDNSFQDVGESWRVANYEQDNIEETVDALFAEIQPLYTELFNFVRAKLVAFYSDRDLDPNGPLPAHILGDMWAQEWTNIYDIVAPYPEVTSYDVTDAMLDQGYTPQRMFELSESFFTSLGLEPMTDTFWEESMFVRPDDRPVQCHASAEDFLTDTDFRIKMCTEVEMADLQTVHHEMGHIEYFMQYRNQPTVFRAGANAAFHEAVGDTMALSVMTPEHLNTIGLLLDDDVPRDDDVREDMCITGSGRCTEDEKKQLNYLMQIALEKVAFLPFAYLVDKWRWEVFRGNIDESNYNSKWWEYRTRYQQVVPPVERSEEDFDPGAKYHVAANVPYIRYFLSSIGQFQFHKALCDVKGHEGPIHHCDIYNSKEAGDLLMSALSLGSSQPWPVVMETLTGQRDFSTEAMFEYFRPLYLWLQEQNGGSP